METKIQRLPNVQIPNLKSYISKLKKLTFFRVSLPKCKQTSRERAPERTPNTNFFSQIPNLK